MDTKNTTTWTTVVFIIFIISAVMIYNNLTTKYNINTNNVLQNVQDSEEQNEATVTDINNLISQEQSSLDAPTKEETSILDTNNSASQNPSENTNTSTGNITTNQQLSDELEPNEEGKAPNFKIYDANGNTISFYNLRGKPIVLNFWASWCGPCKAEMPHFFNAYQDLNDQVTFIMVNMTDGIRETQEKAEKYVRSQGYNFPIYFDKNQDTAYIYKISGIPTTLFIDKDGYIVASYTGSIDENKLLQNINQINTHTK